MNIFFDMDGTILSTEDEVRPYTKHIMNELRKDGHILYMWSGGGGSYCIRHAHKNELSQFIEGYFTKEVPLPNNIIPDLVIDDEEIVIKMAIADGKHGFKIKCYTPIIEDDEEMLNVLKYVRMINVNR